MPREISEVDLNWSAKKTRKKASQHENNECIFGRLHFSIFEFNSKIFEERDI